MANVEIVMGVRDGAAHLSAQLASFLRQSHKDWTLLVSDDGSEDRSHEIVAAFGTDQAQGRVRLIDGPKTGAAANYLHLLANADKDADFIALSDQDDVWFPERLTRGIDALKVLSRERPTLYAAQTVLIDTDGWPLRHRTGRAKSPTFSNALVQNITAGNTIMLNRGAADLAARAQTSRTPPFHDWWLYALIKGAGGHVVIDPQPVLAYRQHGGSILGAHRGWAAGVARARLVANGTWRSWLSAHHRALESVAAELTDENQTRLAHLLHPRVPRLAAFARARVQRQGHIGTAALGLAALAGRA
ncbi:MAG: glycosyltransferase [Pseudomonadota bacterium]